MSNKVENIVRENSPLLPNYSQSKNLLYYAIGFNPRDRVVHAAL